MIVVGLQFSGLFFAFLTPRNLAWGTLRRRTLWVAQFCLTCALPPAPRFVVMLFRRLPQRTRHSVAPIQQGAFREFKVYDKTRQPADWTSLVGPTQCAAFLKDVKTANPLATDGSEIAHLRDCRFLLFDHLEEARTLCEAEVQRYPFMCCEIFDAEGKAKPPLLVIMHPTAARKDELSPTWVKRRKVVAIASLVAAVVLFFVDWRSEYELLWPSLLAVNLLPLGLRLLYWNTASSERSRTQAKRLEEHLQREKEPHRNLNETR